MRAPPPLPQRPSRRPVAPAERFRDGDDPRILDDIHLRHVHSVHYRRRLSSLASNYAAGLAMHEVYLELDSCEIAGLAGLPLPIAPGREDFIEELAFALATFRRLTGNCFQAELSVVRDDACRRFHVDQHQLRWVTTFAGPGTEWIRDEDTPPLPPPRALDVHAFNRALASPRAIRRLARGEVFLMKGKGYSPRAPGRGGPLHRSPPIAGTGTRRLVLTMTLP